MNNQKIMNRWLVVIGAILIQLALGAIYAWSVFTPQLTAPDGVYQFSAGEAAWIFSAGLFFFALVMIWAGRKLATIGPQKLAIAGGITLGLGYVLAGFFGTNFITQLIFIGIIGGSGIGLAYVVPIAVGVKWFPDRKGMLTGLAVAGFGFGATIWVKWAGSWGGGLLNELQLFGLDGVRSVFVLYGIIFAAMVVIGSLVMKDPPQNWLPEGYVPPEANSAKASGEINFETGEMLKTPQFYMLFFTFVFSALAGLMVIYCIKLFGIDA
ncbi:MAG: MFS transporter, partial [Prolixibacteraceae bacterium]